MDKKETDIDSDLEDIEAKLMKEEDKILEDAKTNEVVKVTDEVRDKIDGTEGMSHNKRNKKLCIPGHSRIPIRKVQSISLLFQPPCPSLQTIQHAMYDTMSK